MIDAEAMADAILRVLNAFVKREMIQSLKVSTSWDPQLPLTRSLEIGGTLDLHFFATAVAMEMDNPGILGGDPVKVDDLLSGALPRG